MCGNITVYYFSSLLLPLPLLSFSIGECKVFVFGAFDDLLTLFDVSSLDLLYYNITVKFWVLIKNAHFENEIENFDLFC